MLGIGLGGFSRGAVAGYGIGERMQEKWKERRQTREDAAALQQGQAEYDFAVKAGTAQPNDLDGPMRYAMPSIRNNYAKRGDKEGFVKATEWGTSDQAKQGSRLFASGMLKGQNGDMQGALTDFAAAGQIQGYGGRVEFSAVEPLEGGGIRVQAKGEDGKVETLEFKTPDDVLRFGADRFNPQSAFERWQGGQEAKAKAEGEVATHVAKKRGELGAKTDDDVVRTNLGIGTKSPQYIAAKNLAIRQLTATGQLGNFSTGKTAEQEKAIEELTQTILQQSGGVGVSTTTEDAEDEEMVVDSKTGRLVPAGN